MEILGCPPHLKRWMFTKNPVPNFQTIKNLKDQQGCPNLIGSMYDIFTYIYHKNNPPFIWVDKPIPWIRDGQSWMMLVEVWITWHHLLRMDLLYQGGSQSPVLNRLISPYINKGWNFPQLPFFIFGHFLGLFISLPLYNDPIKGAHPCYRKMLMFLLPRLEETCARGKPCASALIGAGPDTRRTSFRSGAQQGCC